MLCSRQGTQYVFLCVCLFVFGATPPVGPGLLIHEVYRSHTTTHHSRLDSSGRAMSPSQRSLPDNIQHSQQTNAHVSGGIRTHNPRRRAAADVRLRPRDHWDLQYVCDLWNYLCTVKNALNVESIKGGLIDCGCPSHMCNVWRIFFWKENKKVCYVLKAFSFWPNRR